MRHFAFAADHHLPAGKPRVLDVVPEVRVDPLQPLRVEAHLAGVDIDTEVRHAQILHYRAAGRIDGCVTTSLSGCSPVRGR